jgi:hypothetical protein
MTCLVEGCSVNAKKSFGTIGYDSLRDALDSSVKRERLSAVRFYAEETGTAPKSERIVRAWVDEIPRKNREEIGKKYWEFMANWAP